MQHYSSQEQNTSPATAEQYEDSSYQLKQLMPTARQLRTLSRCVFLRRRRRRGGALRWKKRWCGKARRSRHPRASRRSFRGVGSWARTRTASVCIRRRWPTSTGDSVSQTDEAAARCVRKLSACSSWTGNVSVAMQPHRFQVQDVKRIACFSI